MNICEMIELTLQITAFLCYFVGILLMSIETIFGRIKLVNFFANKISNTHIKYLKEVSRFVLEKGILYEEKIIAKIGVFLTLLAMILSIFLLISSKLNLI